MLLHDFPDFLSEFSLSLCNHTADRFVQIRNIILSAFPKALKFPEPQNLAPNASELDKIENSNRLPKYYQLKFDKTYEIAAAMRNEEKFHQLKLRLESTRSLIVRVVGCADQPLRAARGLVGIRDRDGQEQPDRGVNHKVHAAAAGQVRQQAGPGARGA